MSLGQNIYRLRTEHKLSQEDFASAMEVSRQSVSKWENDIAVPELEKLIKMARLFEVSLDELVGNVPLQPKSVPMAESAIAQSQTLPLMTVFGIIFFCFGLLTFLVLAAVGSMGVGLFGGILFLLTGIVCLQPRNFQLQVGLWILYFLMLLVSPALFGNLIGIAIITLFLIGWNLIYLKASKT